MINQKIKNLRSNYSRDKLVLPNNQLIWLYEARIVPNYNNDYQLVISVPSEYRNILSDSGIGEYVFIPLLKNKTNNLTVKAAYVFYSARLSKFSPNLSSEGLGYCIVSNKCLGIDNAGLSGLEAQAINCRLKYNECPHDVKCIDLFKKLKKVFEDGSFTNSPI